MKIICVLLMLSGACFTASSQSTAGAQPDPSDAPFTLTIAAYRSNAGVEDTADFVMKSGTGVGLRIRKTNISDHEISKWPGPSGLQYDVRDGEGNVVKNKNPNKGNYILDKSLERRAQ